MYNLYSRQTNDCVCVFCLDVGGVLINIECKAWAHNIYHDRIERRGSVHFELMVD